MCYSGPPIFGTSAEDSANVKACAWQRAQASGFSQDAVPESCASGSVRSRHSRTVGLGSHQVLTQNGESGVSLLGKHYPN